MFGFTHITLGALVLEASLTEVRGHHCWSGRSAALSARCQVHGHLGAALLSPPAPINHLLELPPTWGRDSVPLLYAGCSANEGVCEIFNYGFRAWLNYLHMAFTSETRMPACSASPQPHV